MGASHESRRGGIYIAVLGVTTLVTVVGLSGLLLADVQRQTAETRLESGASRFEAQSALGVAMSRVAQTPAWNTKYPSKTWTAAEGLGGAQWAFMLEYDQAAADAGQTVDMTINAIAARERAARVYAIDARAKIGGAAPNVIGNGGFETDVSGWRTIAGGNLQRDMTSYHIAPASAWLGARTAPSAGIATNVLPAMVNGARFEFSAWVHMFNGQADTFTASIYHNAGGSFQQMELATASLSGGFSELSGSGTITWIGAPPTTADLLIFTWAEKKPLSVDSVSLLIGSGEDPAITITPGTFRQRILE